MIIHPSSLLPQPLKIQGVIQSDGLRIALWDEKSREMIHQAKYDLEDAIPPVISRSCTHLRGRGGVKGCIRDIQKEAHRYPFVARFDVASFYDSIDHATLLSQFEDTAPPLPSIAVVCHHLTEPDITRAGVGLCAGGSISPLLGALYLKPLDDAFSCRDGIIYMRYMDDVVILAKTRWKLRHAIRLVHQILSELKMQVHETKRFIGRTIQGFDFLGYTIHPFRRLRPSDESIRRLQERTRRLYEQGAPIERLWRYVSKWCQWLWGGVFGKVSRKGGVRKYWVWITKALDLPEHGYLSSVIGR